MHGNTAIMAVREFKEKLANISEAPVEVDDENQSS
jgi:hypothetical protein